MRYIAVILLLLCSYSNAQDSEKSEPLTNEAPEDQPVYRQRPNHNFLPEFESQHPQSNEELIEGLEDFRLVYPLRPQVCTKFSAQHRNLLRSISEKVMEFINQESFKLPVENQPTSDIKIYIQLTSELAFEDVKIISVEKEEDYDAVSNIVNEMRNKLVFGEIETTEPNCDSYNHIVNMQWNAL